MPDIFQGNSDEIVAAKPPFDAQEVQPGGSSDLKLRREFPPITSTGSVAKHPQLGWGPSVGGCALGSSWENSCVSVGMDRDAFHFVFHSIFHCVFHFIFHSISQETPTQSPGRGVDFPVHSGKKIKPNQNKKPQNSPPKITLKTPKPLKKPPKKPF